MAGPGGNKCDYFGCGRSKRTDEGLQLHRFPANKDRLRQWVTNSGNPKLLDLSLHILRSRRICLHHFEDGMFMNVEKKKLRWDAAPMPSSNKLNIEGWDPFTVATHIYGAKNSKDVVHVKVEPDLEHCVAGLPAVKKKLEPRVKIKINLEKYNVESPNRMSSAELLHEKHELPKETVNTKEEPGVSCEASENIQLKTDWALHSSSDVCGINQEPEAVICDTVVKKEPEVSPLQTETTLHAEMEAMSNRPAPEYKSGSHIKQVHDRRRIRTVEIGDRYLSQDLYEMEPTTCATCSKTFKYPNFYYRHLRSRSHNSTLYKFDMERRKASLDDIG